MYYGLVSINHLSDIAESICECLGYGSNKTAPALLIETAGAETHFGTYKDTTLFAGMGITQFDALPFQDVKDRVSLKDKKKIKDHFDIDIDLVEWEHLRYNPLLCFIFTRLKYKKIPDAIPDTLEDRARYWKKWYNSYAGKGTIEHYLEVNSNEH